MPPRIGIPLLRFMRLADPSYQADVDSTEPTVWYDLLDRFEDANIYQTWSYGTVRWGERNLSRLVLRHHGEVVGMAQLRIIRLRFARRGIAYLRWGPLCHLKGRELEAETVSKMATALHEEYVRRRRLYLRILPNAFAGSARADIFQAQFSQFANGPLARAHVERTFLVDLAPPLEELRRRLDQKWRNQLNRAEKNGLKIIEGDDLETYQTFVHIYRQMWGRKQFEEGVDVDEFACIQESLPSKHRMKVLICLQEGTPVAGIVCSGMGDSAVYLLGATGDAGLKAKGGYLLQWTFITWLKQNGFRFYDLGGINPERNPGVYHFKRGFSGQDLSRIAPLESCVDLLSLACAKAADFVRWGRQISSELKKPGTAFVPRRNSEPTIPKFEMTGKQAR